MGSVYRARLEGPGGAAKEVALKLVHRHLSADRNFVLMFLDEMRVAMSMAHRNIVQTFDAGEADGHHYLVMELVDGCSLRELLTAMPGRAMPLDVAVFIAREVSAALGYAHSFRPPGSQGDRGGVIHRDVSPSNILLSSQGDVKLADFGAAKVAGGLHVTGVHRVKGKLAYMAPEQASGGGDRRSDLFALGAVLYRMVTGAPIRKVLDLAEVRRGLPSLPSPSSLRAELPGSLEALILSCLSSDPSGRPASAEELTRGLAEQAFQAQLMGGDLDPHARLQTFIAAAAQRRPAPSRQAEKLGAMLLKEAGALATDHGESAHGGSASVLTTAVLDRAQTVTVSDRTIDEPASAHLEMAAPPVVVPRPRGRWAALLLGLAALAVTLVVALALHRRGAVQQAPRADTGRPPDSGAGSRDQSTPPDLALAPDAARPAEAAPLDQRAPTRVAPPRPATLDLNSIPWSQVHIDGRYRGHTPLQGVLLRPGRHRLRLENPDRGLSRELQLTVWPGQKLRRVIELR